MKRWLGLAIPLSALALSIWAGAALVSADSKNEDDGGHGFVRNQEKCDMCHVVEWKGSAGKLEEALFHSSFVDVCANECHEENLKRSHPVNVSPFKIISRDKYPKFLPLQFSDKRREDVITCATCHKPHGERLGRTKLHPRQREVPDTDGLYLTYYLRVRGFTPKEGYAPLCKSCHPEM